MDVSMTKSPPTHDHIKTELPGVNDRRDIFAPAAQRAAFEQAVTAKKLADGFVNADMKLLLERNMHGGYKSVYYDGAWWVWRLLNGLIPAGEPEDELDDLI